MIFVSETELATINGIIARHFPDCEVFVFGSRCFGAHKKYSDLDLAIKLPQQNKLGLKLTILLECAFIESDLPYRVDIVDYNAISEEFRAIIDAGCKKI